MIAMKIGVAANPTDTMKAFNTIEGLSQWWTQDTRGDTNTGSKIDFLFNGEGPSIEVIKSTADTVIWKCLSGPAEWDGTEIEFKVSNDKETTIHFQHRNWLDDKSDMFSHCSMKWGAFMLSLKSYLDGKGGKAFPNDVKVSTLGY